MRLASKDRREMHELLLSLGYELKRARNHLVYVKPGMPPLSMPQTPSDVRTDRNILAKLKKLHPEHFQQQPKSDREDGPGRVTSEAVVIAHAASLGLRISENKARQLVSRFGGVRRARVALDGMVQAAQRKAA